MKIKTFFNHMKGSLIVIILWLVLGWVSSYGIHSILLAPLNYFTGALAGIDEGSFIGGTIGKTIILLFLSSFITNVILIKGSFSEKLSKAASSYKDAILDTVPFLMNTIGLLTTSLKGLSYHLLGMGISIGAYGFLTGNGAFENSFVTVLIFFNLCGEIADGTGIVSAVLNLMLSRWGRKRVNKEVVEWLLNGAALGCLMSFILAIFVSDVKIAYGLTLVMILSAIMIMVITHKKAVKVTVALFLITSPIMAFAEEENAFTYKSYVIYVNDPYIKTGSIKTGNYAPPYAQDGESYTISNVLKNRELLPEGEAINISFQDGYNRTVDKMMNDLEDYLSNNYNASIYENQQQAQPSEYDTQAITISECDVYTFDVTRNLPSNEVQLSADIVYGENESFENRGYGLNARATLSSEYIHVDYMYVVGDELWIEYTVSQDYECEWPVLQEVVLKTDDQGNPVETGMQYELLYQNNEKGPAGTITHSTVYETTFTIDEYMSEESISIWGGSVIDQTIDYTGIDEDLSFNFDTYVPLMIEGLSFDIFELGDPIFGTIIYIDDEPVDEEDQTMGYEDVAYCDAYSENDEAYRECMGMDAFDEDEPIPLTPVEKVAYGTAAATTLATGISIASKDKKKVIEELMKIASKHVRKISITINHDADLADVVCVEKNTVEIPFSIRGGDDLSWTYGVLMLAQKDHKRILPAVVVKYSETQGLISLVLTGNELINDEEVIECVLTAQSNDEYGHIIEVETISFNLVKQEEK